MYHQIANLKLLVRCNIYPPNFETEAIQTACDVTETIKKKHFERRRALSVTFLHDNFLNLHYLEKCN
jgi:hypothetical protein